MGTILDTTVFITLERAVRTLPQRGAMAEAGRRLEATLGPAEDVGIDVTVQRYGDARAAAVHLAVSHLASTRRWCRHRRH